MDVFTTEDNMSKDIKVSISDGEILAVTPGIDDSNDQPVLVLTIRPNLSAGFGIINVAIRPENGVILAEQLQIALRHDLVKGRYEMPQSIGSLENDDDYSSIIE
jgi:hypothetical protein